MVLGRAGPTGCVFVWGGDPTVNWICRATFCGDKADHLQVLCLGQTLEVEGQRVACLRTGASEFSRCQEQSSGGDREGRRSLSESPCPCLHLPSRSSPQHCLQVPPPVFGVIGLFFLKDVFMRIEVEGWMSGQTLSP